MRGKKGEEKIDKILERFLKRKGFLKKINEFKGRDLWLKVVGDDIASNTQPLEVRDGILFIKTANPILSNELLYLKKEIMGKINKEIGSKTIRDIYFKTGLPLKP